MMTLGYPWYFYGKDTYGKIPVQDFMERFVDFGL